MKVLRSSGILLHPTSLPGEDGIGTLGESARAFVDRLAEAGQSWWQMLPLNPTGPGGSPYSATSTFAMNPMLIDVHQLGDQGWLRGQELHDYLADRRPADDDVDYGDIEPAKAAILETAWQHWREQKQRKREFGEFQDRESWWLEDFALYSALKQAHGDQPWRSWPDPLASREPEALEEARASHAEAIERVKFEQWIVHRQWTTLRDYAAERGVEMIGDIPIFVAMDSAEVWAHREYFQLDELGRAKFVSGVPPDYFSEEGQKWGNPLYDWDALEQAGYDWWLDRVKKVLETVDLIRLDHFRGFEAYWAVPADAENAVNGEWRDGPGDALFEAMRREFGEVPFIAEDLGMITDEVRELRQRQDLPGMKVMQFAFDGSDDHPFLPHTYPELAVAYTGTHDNDTTRGWWEDLDDNTRHQVRTYLSCSGGQVVWRMIEAILDSDAMLAVIPMQDVFELDSDARMNLPGQPEGNWSWRMAPDMLLPSHAWERLFHATEASERQPDTETDHD
ncbi:MAG: 4-alpha-glucanotransferase [Myxococcota bacterium]